MSGNKNSRPESKRDNAGFTGRSSWTCRRGEFRDDVRLFYAFGIKAAIGASSWCHNSAEI
ncbi:MAG: hypothetical protein FJ146_15295 [Deltaproteobacteria bacterium]|nr:hypothetical protein [Deltaproteobacteria bacterium]